MSSITENPAGKPQSLQATQIAQALEASNKAMHKLQMMCEHYKNIATGHNMKAKMPPYCTGYKAEAEEAIKLNTSLFAQIVGGVHVEI